jgi:hypothetical protein
MNFRVDLYRSVLLNHIGRISNTIKYAHRVIRYFHSASQPTLYVFDLLRLKRSRYNLIQSQDALSKLNYHTVLVRAI